jgi:Family of unknown function (DUF5989)
MLRYFFRLLRDLGGYAWRNKAWWMIPLGLTLLLLGFVVVAAKTGMLAGLYTLF